MFEAIFKIIGTLLGTTNGRITLGIICVILLPLIIMFSAESPKKEKKRKEQEAQQRMRARQLNSFADYERATREGRSISMAEYEEMREHHRQNFKEKYPARIRYPVKVGHCPLHRIPRQYRDGCECEECYHEFSSLALRMETLPQDYRRYADVLNRAEWFYLSMQDKHVQLGELTADEARTNKQDFIAHFVPLWEERYQLLQQQRGQMEEENKLRNPAKPIW